MEFAEADASMTVSGPAMKPQDRLVVGLAVPPELRSGGDTLLVLSRLMWDASVQTFEDAVGVATEQADILGRELVEVTTGHSPGECFGRGRDAFVALLLLDLEWVARSVERTGRLAGQCATCIRTRREALASDMMATQVTP